MNLLPYLEQTNLHDAINFSAKTPLPGNQTVGGKTVRQTVIPAYICPTSAHQKFLTQRSP